MFNGSSFSEFKLPVPSGSQNVIINSEALNFMNMISPQVQVWVSCDTAPTEGTFSLVIWGVMN